MKTRLDLVRLMGEVASIANGCDRLEDAAGRSLGPLHEVGGWDVGHVYLFEEDTHREGPAVLRGSETWEGADDSAGFLEFRRASEGLDVEPGVGWLGSVLEAAEPIWVADVERDLGFSRSGHAIRAGLRSGLAFPIVVDSGVVGIVELFSRMRRESDALVTELMVHIGKILGSVHQREHDRRELDAARGRFEVLFSLLPLPAAVLTYPEGRYVEVNRRFEETFGWERQDVVGRTDAELGMWHDLDARQALLGRVPRAPNSIAVDVSLRGRGGRSVVGHTTVTRISWYGTPHLLGILLDLSERLETERQLERRRAEVEFLIQRLLGLQEDERSRLARELHDGIGQTLTALKLKVGQLGTAQADARDRLVRETLTILDGALEGARALSFDLRPAMLDELGLANAVRTYVSRQARGAGLSVDLRAPEEVRDWPKEAQTACYRILQEAVTNVVRHAGASSIGVRLSEGPEGLVLRVEDDGCGFQSDRRNGHLGLLIMRERAELNGGTVEVQTDPGSGTVVTVRFPAGEVVT